MNCKGDPKDPNYIRDIDADSLTNPETKTCNLLVLLAKSKVMPGYKALGDAVKAELRLRGFTGEEIEKYENVGNPKWYPAPGQPGHDELARGCEKKT